MKTTVETYIPACFSPVQTTQAHDMRYAHFTCSAASGL